MSVAVCRNPASGFESILMLTCKETVDTTLPHPKTRPPPPPPPSQAQFDIWTSIQAQNKAHQSPPPYVHPRMTRSSSGLLSENSLQICTENLGSESGSDDYFSSDDESQFFSSISANHPHPHKREKLEAEEPAAASLKKSNTRSVNYHCSISRKSSAPRSFPPPLPSISRRDGPCFQMRPHRSDGRLVVEAVAVPSQNYLHAERQNGRLLLSFINTTTSYPTYREEEVVEVEEEEEEVEVVDRGTMVEVKVSTQPQKQSKVHRSSIVINKFVSCTAIAQQNSSYSENVISCTAIADHDLSYSDTTVTRTVSPVRRLQATATTTAAAAAVAASSVSAFSEESQPSITITTDNKLLFASKRRNREELLHDMRRCSQLKKPLFIWEPCCIATSSSC